MAANIEKTTGVSVLKSDVK
uniref:Uncharacterized protein n=1 Tax=Rhizophora mucronata TaxID=61149 RepID=A0A2P2QBB1_RHIMU